MTTVALLFASSVFMTLAWYGHLRYREVALWKVILISWGIAFFAYCLQVPANRWGYGQFTGAQEAAAFALVVAAVVVVNLPG